MCVNPILLMLFMVWLRTQIKPTYIESSSLLALRHPTYMIQTSENKLEPLETTKLLEGYQSFNNYTDIFGIQYDVLYDLQAPTYFYPSNCGSSASIMLDGTPSQIIAIVGQNNTVSWATRKYLETLLFSQNVLGAGLQPTFQQFESQQDLFDYISSDTYLMPDMGVCFGFEITENDSNDWNVNLYFDDQHLYGGASAAGIPSQNQPAYDKNENKPLLNAYEKYALDGFTFLQNIIANMVLREATNNPNANINMMIVPMKSDDVTVDRFVAVNTTFANLVSLLFILPVFNMVFFIVKEKEYRVKESMRMMGMSDFPYWMSWFVYYSILNSLTSLLATLTLSINVFTYSNYVYIFLTIWLYGESIFGEIVIIQSLFSRSQYAGLVASVFYFMVSMVNLLFISGDISKATSNFMSIIPQYNMFHMVYYIFSLEGVGLGMTKREIWTQSNSNYTPGVGFIMYVVGGALLTLLGLYLDSVLPTEYGARKHPCFCFKPKSYTCCKNRRQQLDDDMQPDHAQSLVQQADNDDLEIRNLQPQNYEAVSAEIARQELDDRFLRIENLQKTYDNGFQAVKGLNLKMYQNQIFALLGQNGAGKSTTISMLTGLIENTLGSARVFGLDMFRQSTQVRQFMGVCPQHDILFGDLTPIEHLNIFYDFKGGDPAKKQQEIVDLIRDVGLEEDQLKPAGSLSGGNRRKLSVAIAMCGGSKLVLLDEPTAGMDLGARRALWDMLKNYRSDRIIILTTHYMDEADVLGDRIGIMAKGQMMCLGSSLFLKKRFGAGYKLTMVKATKEQNEQILPYLQSNLGPAELISEVSSEISFGVTDDVAERFTEFFQQFDKDMRRLGIVSYGISITTLEEVFLHINQEFGLDQSANDGSDNINNKAQDNNLETNNDLNKVHNIVSINEEVEDGPELNNSLNDLRHRYSVFKEENPQNNLNSSFSSRASFQKITTDLTNATEEQTERLVFPSSLKDNISALLTKRFNIYKRDRTGLVCELLVPFIMVFVGCCITKIQFGQDKVTRTLSPDLYPSPQRILMNQANVVNAGEGDIPPQVLFANLPQSSTEFEVTYIDNATFYEFYDQTFEARLDHPYPYSYGSYQIYKADNETMQYSVNTFVNLTSQDVTGLYPQFIYQSILQTATGNPDFNFQVNTVPYPTLYALQIRREAGNAFEFSFMVGVGISLIPCAMISFILKERMHSLKHMQLISGMSLKAYWISNMIADIIKVYIPCMLILLLSVVFKTNYEGVGVLFCLLPFALVPFTYITSFLFNDDTNSQILTLLINFVVCIILANTVYTLQIIPETMYVGDKLRWYLCVFPTYCLMNGLLWSSSGQNILTVRQQQPDKYPQLPTELWAFENLGGDVFFLLLHFVVDTAILGLIEANAFDFIKKRLQASLPERDLSIQLDSDVKAEELRVAETNDEVVRVFNFRKQYGTSCGKQFLAVENITFGLDYGECFALLGVNGAGKSTTFKSLTADVQPSAGEITISGFNTSTQFEDVRKLIGYCPQHDAIFPLMTVEEHLWFYAKLKGIPEAKRQKEIEKAINNLNIADHRNKEAGTLSGGNKRKLSVAMATLGNPPIILLDEPSAGMDPEARRFMWQVVANISQRDKNSAVIITTHSMEEAEALSTKMGIMVRGGIFRCYGSSQHIKSKFGTGYEIEIKIKKPAFAKLMEYAENLSFLEGAEDRVDLEEALLRAKVRGIKDLLIEQVKLQGLGADLVIEANSSGSNSVRVRNLITYFYTLTAGLKVIEYLCSHFAKVELYEQCGDFFKMRIPRDDKTIGYIFGIVQQKKESLQISEYSVSETSLEQIFQTFANQSSKKISNSFVFQLDQDSKGIVIVPAITTQ